MDETDLQLQITATLQGGGTRTSATTIALSVHDLTATAGSDYTAASPVTLTIPAGELSGTAPLSLTLVNDDLHEDSEHVAIRGSNEDPGLPVGGVLVRIDDDDEAPTQIFLFLDRNTVAEGGGPQRLTVTARSQGNGKRAIDTRLRLTTGEGTKKGGGNARGDDYTALSVTLTIPAGEKESDTVVVISPTDDSIDEEDETLEIRGSASLSSLEVRSEFVTITDNDTAAVTISPTTLDVPENGSATYIVALDTQPAGDVIVTINDPTDNTDVTAEPAKLTFTPANWDTAQTVTFAAGETSKSFSFTATADDVDDDGESVALNFGTLPEGVSAGTTDTATVNITDDDVPSVAVSFGQATYDVGEGSSETVTVTLDADPERDVTIPITAAGQGGTSNDDYSGVPESLTFASGETEQTFTFTAAADDVDDDGESVALSFGTLPEGVSAGTTATATVNITDDDVPSVTVSFDAASYPVNEGESVTVTVTLDADPERDVTVPLTATNQDGASDSDHSGVPAELTFAAGETSKSFSFTATADDVDDDGESVALSFGTLPEGVSAGTTATLSITDDDVPSVAVSFEQATYDAVEGEGVTVTVELSADPERTVTIPLTATNQDGASDSDYSGVPAELTFASGETEQTFIFTAAADDENDDGESVALSFGTLPAGVSAGTTATVNITDDDVPSVTVSFGQATYDAAEGESVTVTVTLDADPEREVTIPITAAGQGGTSNDDYSGVPGSVFFGSSETEKSFTFTAAADDENDDGESVALSFGTLPDGVSAGTTATATVNITDDDVPSVAVSFGQATYDAAEGESVTVTVTLDADPERTVTIPIAAADQGGASAADHSVVPASLTFASGEMEKSFTFTATADEVDDDGESVALSFGTLPAGVSAGTTATVNITDDDVPSVAVSFEQATYDAVEGEGVTVTVTLDADPERTVTVPLTATNQDGASDSDYSGVPAELTFVAGETSKSFSFDAAADDVDDDGESVALSFGTLPAGLSAAPPNSATVTLMNVEGEITPLEPCQHVWCGTAVLKWAEDQQNGEVTVPYIACAPHCPESSLTSSSFTADGVSYNIANIIVGRDMRSANIEWSRLKFDIETRDSATGDIRGPTAAQIESWTLYINESIELHLSDTAYVVGRTGFVWRDETFVDFVDGTVLVLRIEDDSIPASAEQTQFDENTPATGQPAITGTVQAGETLVVDTSGIADADGMNNASFAYQWLVGDGTSDTDIQDATGPTYTLPNDYAGSLIRVKVSFTDGAGNEEVLVSNAVAGVTATVPNTPATGQPTIIGTVQVGETLAVDTSGIADADGLDNASFSYQWLADNTDITGATDSTYTLLDADEGKTIKVRVSFTDDAGNEETLTSAHTEAVTGPLTASLENTPDAHDGETAFTFELRFSEEPEPDFSYEALRDHAFTVVGGEVTNARRMDRDSGTPNIQWEITVRPNGDGDVTITLPETTDCEAEGAICTEDGRMLYNGAMLTVVGPGQPVAEEQQEEEAEEPENSPATGTPAISGTVRVGETLTADTSSIADADGLDNASFSYQWLADGAETDGSTGSTYFLSAADEGRSMSVRVSFTDDAGNEETLTSAHTEAVTGPPSSPLTARLENTPDAHDGATAFTFELRFSEEPEPDFSYETLRDHAFMVVGGEVTNARRMDRDSGTPNIQWEITVRPNGDGDVTITLPETTDCEAEGAICTEDGRMLYNGAMLTVVGPGQPVEEEEQEEAEEPENSPATGAPAISGTVRVGETLTADTSSIADADGLDNASFSYQWLADDTDITGATDSTYSLLDADEGNTIKVRVSFTDDAGNEETLTGPHTEAVTGPPSSPLTARLENTPDAHDGATAFTFELRFSEEPEPDFSYKTLRDHAFMVTGGTVTNAIRVAPPGNILWKITVKPSGNGDVVITLLETTDCSNQGAICTGDGRMLSNQLELTIDGPSD